MHTVVARLCDIAEGQSGHVTFKQAELSGVPDQELRDLADAGVIETVTPHVFRLRAGGRHPYPALYAAWLATEPQTPGWLRQPPDCAVVARGSALRVHGVGDQPSSGYQFIVPVGQQRQQLSSRTEGSPVLVEAELGPEDWLIVQGMPVTTPGRTLADLAVAGGTDISDIRRLAVALLRTGRARSDELLRALDRAAATTSSAFGGSALIRDALEAFTAAATGGHSA